MIELVFAFYVCVIALKREGEDWMKVEKTRDETLTSGDVSAMIDQVERVRRVTWRMGVLGSCILSTLLFFMDVIPLKKWMSCAAGSWIIITTALNFRAYHLEDEGTKVYKSFYSKRNFTSFSSK